VTGLTTSNVQIHNVRIDVQFENHPGSSACTTVNGVTSIWTGTLSGGRWTGNGANQHEVIFTNAEGLVSHGPTGSVAVTLSGTFRDTAQTLTLT
jgi:hypothetical protein